MFPVLLLSWWYSRGWFWVANNVSNKLTAINEAFSVGILLKTLFAPWKQIQSPTSFRNFLQSSIDNFISRFIGATVRIGMLIGAVFSFAVVILIGLVALVLWPVVPLLIVILPIISLKVGGL